MEKPRIVITLEGGLIQGITSDQPVEILVLDFDASDFGGEDDDITTIETYPTGKVEQIYNTCPYKADISEDFVNHFFKQF
jgi:hypothetical protein